MTRGHRNPLDRSAAAERILYIDILRGMALFGILAANMRGFDAPADVYGNIKVLFHGRADMIAQGFIDIFIQGKFVTLFSFLFGLGFAVQLTRAEARGAKFMSFYPRRLAALALFGLIHGLLIWWGDILFTYALAGTLLLLFRKRAQKTLLWWAGEHRVSSDSGGQQVTASSSRLLIGRYQPGKQAVRTWRSFNR